MINALTTWVHSSFLGFRSQEAPLDGEKMDFQRLELPLNRHTGAKPTGHWDEMKNTELGEIFLLPGVAPALEVTGAAAMVKGQALEPSVSGCFHFNPSSTLLLLIKMPSMSSHIWQLTRAYCAIKSIKQSKNYIYIYINSLNLQGYTKNLHALNVWLGSMCDYQLLSQKGLKREEKALPWHS